MNLTNLECTLKVQKIRSKLGDEEASRKIGLSKNTMYKRIKSNKWKLVELSHIKNIEL